jgi:hypothetical protein
MDGETGVYSQPIAAEISAEAAKLRWAGAVDIVYPFFELGASTLADQDHESLCQPSARGKLAAAPA